MLALRSFAHLRGCAQDDRKGKRSRRSDLAAMGRRNMLRPTVVGECGRLARNFLEELMIRVKWVAILFAMAMAFCGVGARAQQTGKPVKLDRKSTRLNSSHQIISYAVFCLKKKKKKKNSRVKKT